MTLCDHRYTPTYLDCLRRYRHRPEIQTALYQALQELAQQPFGNPKLQTHRVERAQPDSLGGDSPLARAGLTRAYLRQEIDWLIKGRGLADRAAYLAAERNGRGTPLPRELRAAVWDLHERYQAGPAEQNLVDFNDLLTRAYEVARALDEPVFDAVIIDEAQDLTETAVRLLAALVDPAAPDCLLLVGDGQQSIYPGGFHLASAGVDVRGRAQVLTRNYRNAGAVYRLAAAVVNGRPFDDGGEQLETERGTVELARHGRDARWLGWVGSPSTILPAPAAEHQD